MRAALCLLLATLFPACSLLTEDDAAPSAPPGLRAVVGTIYFYDEAPVTDLPATVQAGAPFTVRIVTYGDGCYQQGPTQVDQQGLRATVTPYDYVPSNLASVACPAVLRSFEHTAALQFDQPGTAEVLVAGLRRDAAHDGTAELRLHTIQVE